MTEYIIISRKTNKEFPPKEGEVRMKKYKKKGVETTEWCIRVDGKWKYHPIPDEFRRPVGGALPAGTIVEDKNKDGKVNHIRQKQEDGSWKYLPLPEKYRSNYTNPGLPEGSIRVEGARTYKKKNKEWVLVEQREKKNVRPEGTVRWKQCGERGITEKKVNGKWVTVYKDREDYIIPENTPIGKKGPRPELRKLVYGVGINDVMIPEFTSSKIWHVWAGILRRTDGRDPVHLELSPTYKDCTCDPRWFRLSAFKEWVESWDDYENKQVDKDILIPGNKHYGPDTCLMVTRQINSWFKEYPQDYIGDLPIGVTRTSNKKKSFTLPYRAQIMEVDPNGGPGTKKHLGYFTTVELASDAYKNALREARFILYENETDPIVKKALGGWL
tara:strand:- start:42 stop:1196 length:1155 start_codon:yes stop_codon:yes gene_type:complete